MPEVSSFSPRTARVVRNTNETQIEISLNLDGEGRYEIATGVGFLDHMLDLFTKHGAFDLTVRCTGDLHVDDHHTVEDIGIALGMAFLQAIDDKAYINRYGHAYVPMDDVLARVVVDLSGRFYLHFDVHFGRDKIGDLSTEMIRHFWYSFAEQLKCNLHIETLHGENSHHKAEAVFKSAGRALREAVARDPRNASMPSTKGVL